MHLDAQPRDVQIHLVLRREVHLYQIPRSKLKLVRFPVFHPGLSGGFDSARSEAGTAAHRFSR